MTHITHKFAIGDRVVYTNDFGVCWGLRTITGLDERMGKPTYHIEPSDTPWFSKDEKNFKLANNSDLYAHVNGKHAYWQQVHGWTPTIEQLGGCY